MRNYNVTIIQKRGYTMYRLYLAAVDMLPGAIILLPVFLLLNWIYFHNTSKCVCYYLFSCYLSVVYVLVGMPNIAYIRPELNLNLIPVLGILHDWKNSILNILLFVPLGLFLPILWNRFRAPKATVLFGFGMSLVIELAQMLTFRATDVNDLITNTLGSCLGYLGTTAFLRKHPLTVNGKMRELGIVLIIIFLVMFFVYPFVSSALWNWILS